MSFEITQIGYYRTRGGAKVKVTSVDGFGKAHNVYSIFGFFIEPVLTGLKAWKRNGTFGSCGEYTEDIVAVWEEEEPKDNTEVVKAWVARIPNGGDALWLDKGTAEAYAKRNGGVVIELTGVAEKKPPKKKTYTEYMYRNENNLQRCRCAWTQLDEQAAIEFEGEHGCVIVKWGLRTEEVEG